MYRGVDTDPHADDHGGRPGSVRHAQTHQAQVRGAQAQGRGERARWGGDFRGIRVERGRDVDGGDGEEDGGAARADQRDRRCVH